MSHTILKYRVQDLHRLYESNYYLLARLVPYLDAIREGAVSTSAKTADLYLHIQERTRYTTVLSLTYRLSIGNTAMPAPDLWLRVYHDACVVEAIPHLDGRGPAHSRVYNLQLGLDADIKWKLNNLLEKWLKNCLQLGHVFSEEPMSEPRILGMD